jgi:hypothetical protein
LLTGNPAIGLASSKAINAGDDGVIGSPLFLSTDQRGKPRLRGQHVDIGAYEAKAAGVTLPDTVVPRQGTAGIPLNVLTEALDGLGPLVTSQAPGVPGDGLGAYQFELRYNPNVLQVLDVLGGASPFDGVTAKNINNQSGIVKWNHFQATDPVGPVGATNLANVVVQAVGELGSCSPLGLVVVDLVNTNGEFIPNTDVDGRVCVVAPLSTAAVTGSSGEFVAIAGNLPSGVSLAVGAVESGSVYPQAGVPVAAYSATVSYDTTLAEVTACRLAAFYAQGRCTIDVVGGRTTLEAHIEPPPAPGPTYPLTMLMPLRPLSSVNSTVSVDLDFSDVLDDVGGTIAQETLPSHWKFKRGDAKADGSIPADGALFISQYLVNPVGKRAGEAPGHLNLINAGSVKHDTPFDNATIADAVFIPQHLNWLRDEFMRRNGP